MKMKNPFYLIGSIVSFLGGLAAIVVFAVIIVMLVMNTNKKIAMEKAAKQNR